MNFIRTFGLTLLLLILLPSLGSAATEAVILAPAIFEKDVSRGESLSFRLKVTNQTNLEKTFYVTAYDFKPADDESGKPLFLDVPESSNSASTWFSFPESSFVIKPGSRLDIPVDITIPTDAGSGGYYASVVISDQNPVDRSKQGATVGLASEVGSLVLLKVTGSVVEKGKLIEVYPEKKWIFNNTLKVFTRFENLGNVHIKPTGLLEISDMAGRKEASIQINSTFSNVLPSSSRKFDNTWEPEPYFGIFPKFGRYKIESIVTYGTPLVTAKGETFYVWLIPAKFLLIMFGIIMGFLIGLYIFMQAYKAKLTRELKRN